MERAAYRIVDANFNRAREAFRVMEDIARFCLNSAPMSSRAKSLRHELCAIVGVLDNRFLLASRDTPGDAGTTVRVENQLSRSNLPDCLTAASRRAVEALRVLSETIQALDHTLAARLEGVRYACYTLEKDITLAFHTRGRIAGIRLCVLISSSLPADIFRLTSQCCKGAAQCLQLRAKNLPDAHLLAVASEFVAICRQHGVISIINDRADVAVAAGADGVHLGQDDLPTAAVRKLQLSPLIVGRSTHDTVQLQRAIEEGADYVGIGPVFATQTKPDAEVAGLDYLRQAVPMLTEAGILGLAVGGITLENLRQVRSAGAAAIAVSAAIISSPDPTAACKLFASQLLE
ncbi:MAG TPA: thiamine phosphate synthase, partial [Sedimentisphaerales bacterium]|nr:thiamine phosphate synthase [Sedimentisphaerales bacterium]